MIETERLLLRAFKATDLNDMNEFCSQPQIETVGWSAHKSIAETEKVLAQWAANDNIFAIVYKQTDKVIGYIAVHEDSEDGRADTKELGFAMNNEYRRHGFMQEAVTAVLDYLFAHGIEYVWACCIWDNTPSKSLIEKLRFQFIGEGNFFSLALNKEVPSLEYRMSKSDWVRL